MGAPDEGRFVASSVLSSKQKWHRNEAFGTSITAFCRKVKQKLRILMSHIMRIGFCNIPIRVSLKGLQGSKKNLNELHNFLLFFNGLDVERDQYFSSRYQRTRVTPGCMLNSLLYLQLRNSFILNLTLKGKAAMISHQ